MSDSATWDYYVHLMDLQNTAPTREERDAARREKLEIEVAATQRAYAQRPSPPVPTGL